MGKQLEGDYLKWPLDRRTANHVRQQAITQLLHLWNAGLQKRGYPPLWGDEIEYAIVHLDKSARRATLSLTQSTVLKKLDKDKTKGGEFTAEFAKYMVEGMPDAPFGPDIEDMMQVEESMRNRRCIISRNLRPGEVPFTLSIFPRLGKADAAAKITRTDSGNEINGNPEFPDGFVSSETRYQAANKNVPARRETLGDFAVSKFKDKLTDDEPIRLEETIFGPGHCGLQVTFQVDGEKQARILHDQLIPLGPIMLALTAATPIYKGFLADTDTRWNQISKAVDDRMTHECGNGPDALPPRWSCNPTYVANVPALKDEYQLPDLALNDEAYAALSEAGMDPLIARHFAHLFVRDPIMIAKDGAEPGAQEQSTNDPAATATTHIDALIGTVWPHVRLKMPPLDDDAIGWRVEFRSMETQLTDFENAAFSIFLALLRRVVLAYNLDLYMPLADVQANMDLAHARGFAGEKFRFRTNFDGRRCPGAKPEWGYHTVDEIVNGGGGVPGLIPLIEEYLDTQGVKPSTIAALRPYLDLVRRRASGEIMTAAGWIRDFVREHKGYKGDSAVDAGVCYDLMVKVEGLMNGEGREGSGLF